MKTRLYGLCFSLIFIVSCAGLSDLSKGEGGEGETGLGSSPFSTGGRFTATQANAINDAVNENAADMAVIHAITGIVKCDGAGTCTAATDGVDYNVFDETADVEPTGTWDWSGVNGATTWPTFNQNTSGTAANLSGTPALPDGVTATTQAHDDFTAKLTTNAFAQTVSGHFGSNLLVDPDFDLVGERSLPTWETTTTADFGPGAFGEYGMGTVERYGVRLEHASKKYDYIYQRRDIPVILGRTYGMAIHYKANAAYADDQNNGAVLQVEILKSDGSQSEVCALETGVGTLGSWAWATGECTITETDAAYGAPSLYIYDSGASGTSYIDVDYVIFQDEMVNTQDVDVSNDTIATTAFAQAISSKYGANYVRDSDFSRQTNGYTYWTTTVASDRTSPVYGAYGEDGRNGAKFEYDGTKGCVAESSIGFPVKAGDLFRVTYDVYLSSVAEDGVDYSDATNSGAYVQIAWFDKDGTYVLDDPVYSGVGTLGSWISVADTVTISGDTAQTAYIYVGVWDATEAGTGFAYVDKVSVVKIDTYYSESTHTHTGFQTTLTAPADPTDITETDYSKWNNSEIAQTAAAFLAERYGWVTYLAAQPSNPWVGQEAWVNGYTAGYDPLDLHTSSAYDGAYKVYVKSTGTWNSSTLDLVRIASGTMYFNQLALPSTTSGDQTLTAGQIGLKIDEDLVVIHGGASGEVQDEAGISLIQQIVVPFDPTDRYDNTTNHIVSIMTLGDAWPHGFTLTQWRLNYVDGDPTTELDADLMCDTTPDFDPAANATVMDALDTTAGASGADSGFESATCANASKIYIRINADPVDDPVTIHFEMEGFANED